MSIYVGGLRARLIGDSLFEMVRASLVALGWTGTNRQHLPLNFVRDQLDSDVEVPLNTLGVSEARVDDVDLEMGSNYTEDRWSFYVDFYAENDAVGRHLIHDVRDILRGKIPSIGRSRPVLEVVDYTQAATPTAFVCQLERIEVDRAVDFPQPWRRFWFSARVDVVDVYGDENDT